MEHRIIGESFGEPGLHFRHELKLVDEKFRFTFEFGTGEYVKFEELLESIKSGTHCWVEVHESNFGKIAHRDGFVTFEIYSDYNGDYTSSEFSIKAEIVYDALLDVLRSEE